MVLFVSEELPGGKHWPQNAEELTRKQYPHHHKQVNDEPFLLSNIDLQTQQEAPVGRVHLGVYVSWQTDTKHTVQDVFSSFSRVCVCIVSDQPHIRLLLWAPHRVQPWTLNTLKSCKLHAHIAHADAETHAARREPSPVWRGGEKGPLNTGCIMNKWCENAKIV